MNLLQAFATLLRKDITRSLQPETDKPSRRRLLKVQGPISVVADGEIKHLEQLDGRPLAQWIDYVTAACG